MPRILLRFARSRGEGVSVAPTSSDRLDTREIARLSGAWLKLEAGDGGANERVVEMARLRQ